MISKEEVLKIAKLARLELTDAETEKMQKDMSAILDYFDLLNKVKSSKLEAKSQNKEVKNVLREDKALDRPASLANNLIAQAPNRQENYIKVKQIL